MFFSDKILRVLTRGSTQKRDDATRTIWRHSLFFASPSTTYVRADSQQDHQQPTSFSIGNPIAREYRQRHSRGYLHRPNSIYIRKNATFHFFRSIASPPFPRFRKNDMGLYQPCHNCGSFERCCVFRVGCCLEGRWIRMGGSNR